MCSPRCGELAIILNMPSLYGCELQFLEYVIGANVVASFSESLLFLNVCGGHLLSGIQEFKATKYDCICSPSLANLSLIHGPAHLSHRHLHSARLLWTLSLLRFASSVWFWNITYFPTNPSRRQPNGARGIYCLIHQFFLPVVMSSASKMLPCVSGRMERQ